MYNTLFLTLISLGAMISALQPGDIQADLVDIQNMNALFHTDYQGQIYSGYLNADKAGTTKFHYLFYPSQDEPFEKPVILWLQGGPGCSSLIGAFTENGPFIFKEGTIEFENNVNSWTSFANLLYIESPITVGYSLGNIQQQSDESTAKYNVFALIDFFDKFENYRIQKFYIAGESYAGIYIPTLTSEIIDYNANPTNPNVLKINLQGIAIGNGCTSPSECTMEGYKFPIHRYHFMGRQGFISDDLYQQVINSEQECYGSLSDKCNQISDAIDTQIGMKQGMIFNLYNLYGECYTYTPEGSKRMKSGLRINEEDDGDVPPCADVTGLYHWLKNTEVRNLLHVDQNAPEWVVCSVKMNDYQINPLGSYYLYPKIIKNKIRIIKFSGDIDAMVPITGTMSWINQLQMELMLNTIKPWRPWVVPGIRPEDSFQNAGNVVDLEGLTFISFRNSGHEVAGEKRLESSLMIQKFINSEYWP